MSFLSAAEGIAGSFSQQPWTAAAIATTAVISLLSLAVLFRRNKSNTQSLPPHIPSILPFIGCAIGFGKSPIEFLVNAHKKYGDVFSFTMVGKTFTYLIGSNASAMFFNSKNDNLNAEDVYSHLMTPIFGEGVAYDVPNEKFLEQKKMMKYGLSIAHYRRYIPMIESETRNYFKRWGDSGEKDIFKALSELIILTASSCLHGSEIRSLLNEDVAQLYSDLDGGLTHAAWLLPGWLPLPSFKRRDNANKELKKIFSTVIRKRREVPAEEQVDDILNHFMTTTYKDGSHLSDNEITGMLIGLLMAGQHTSSTTSAWLGFFLASDQQQQDKVFREQTEVCGGDLTLPLNYEQVKEFEQLDRCLKETLRLRPPIMTMMRNVRVSQTVGEFTIPAGHQVCVSPTVNHIIGKTWTDPKAFSPDRFQQSDTSNSEKFCYVPFGAGRHRCLGESFAYVQIKTIWSVLLRLYKFDLVDGYFPPVNYQTMIHTPTNPIIRYSRRNSS